MTEISTGNVAKQEQWELEDRIHTLSNEGGVRAIREFLERTRDAISEKWPMLTGDDLIRMQGTALNIKQLLRIIDEGPKHKPNPAEPPK